MIGSIILGKLVCQGIDSTRFLLLFISGRLEVSGCLLTVTNTFFVLANGNGVRLIGDKVQPEWLS